MPITSNDSLHTVITVINIIYITITDEFYQSFVPLKLHILIRQVRTYNFSQNSSNVLASPSSK